MKRTFTIETSETDEKALMHSHLADQVEFAFNSILASIVNGARDQFVRDARQRATETGEFIPNNPETIIANFTLKTADERHAEHLAKLAEEQAERDRQEQERLDELARIEEERKKAEEERIKAAVAAALAERDQTETP